ASRSTRAAFTGLVRPRPRLEALLLLGHGVQSLSGLAVPAACFLLFCSGGMILLVVLPGGPVDRGQQRRLFLLNGLQIAVQRGIKIAPGLNLGRGHYWDCNTDVSHQLSSGFSSPSIVGISSDTVG